MKGKINDDKSQTNQGATQVDAQIGSEDNATAIDYAAEIAQRDTRIAEADERIAELEVALEATNEKSEELKACNETLQTENEQLKAQAETDRMNFALALAGCRNVKAACAVLDDYNGDIEALKSAEPWLFAAHAEANGATGLPNAGAAKDDGKDERRWRRLAGLSQKKSND
ncbi:MAG: hypothetical protein IJ087_06790 [Eggerthellaceae bacterium]|nr:hypothetical protein [Eggerthellaceae bacterium]